MSKSFFVSALFIASLVALYLNIPYAGWALAVSAILCLNHFVDREAI